MSYPVKELKVTLDDFFGPFVQNKLQKISAKIADELILEFRNRLKDHILKEVTKIHLSQEESDKNLKIIIEDRKV